MYFYEFTINHLNTTPVKIYGEPYAHKLCVVDIFLNITRLQAKSPVAKFYRVLGRGFMIHQVKLILIKCLSANQNQQSIIFKHID